MITIISKLISIVMAIITVLFSFVGNNIIPNDKTEDPETEINTPVGDSPVIEEPDSSDKILYYYEDGTTGYEPKPGAKCQRSDGSWNVLPGGKIVLEYEDGSLGYVYKPNAVYFDSLDVDPDTEVLFHYEDGTTGYEPKPGANYKANGIWRVVAWNNDFFNLTDEEIREIMEEANKYCEHCGREDCFRLWTGDGQNCPNCGVFVPVAVCHHCS